MDPEVQALTEQLKELIRVLNGSAGNTTVELNNLTQSAGNTSGALNGFGREVGGFTGIIANTSQEIARRLSAVSRMQQGSPTQAVSEIAPELAATTPVVSFVESQTNLATEFEKMGVAIAGQVADLTDIQGVLRMSPEQLQNLARDAQLLRSTGGTAEEGLRGVAETMRQLEADGAITREQLRALGIAFDEQGAYVANYAQIIGPALLSLENGFADLDDIIDENIQRQNALNQVYGVSIAQQIENTERILSSATALSRQMDIITNPVATNNLQRFANITAAIGESRLAEGFIGGLGIPTPGNELEAALKPQTTAILSQMNQALARGDQREYNRLEQLLPEIQAQENAGLLRQLGPIAPYLVADDAGFGFLNEIASTQRAQMLGTARNQATGRGSFVGQQMTEARYATADTLQGAGDPVYSEAIELFAEISRSMETAMSAGAAGLRTDLASTFTQGAAEIAAAINGSADSFLRGMTDSVGLAIERGITTDTVKMIQAASIGELNIDADLAAELEKAKESGFTEESLERIARDYPQLINALNQLEQLNIQRESGASTNGETPTEVQNTNGMTQGGIGEWIGNLPGARQIRGLLNLQSSLSPSFEQPNITEEKNLSLDTESQAVLKQVHEDLLLLNQTLINTGNAQIAAIAGTAQRNVDALDRNAATWNLKNISGSVESIG